jgi:hypothetical protein
MQSDTPRASLIVTVAIPNATANDAATWCATAFPGDALPAKPKVWADYPGVGYSADRVTITTNQFTFPAAQAQFRYAQVMSLDSATLYDCSAARPVAQVFAGTQTLDPNGFPGFALQPAQTVDSTASSQLLLSSQVFGKGSYLVIWRIKSTASGFKLKKGVVSIGKAFPPILGTQGGAAVDDGNLYWDTGDGRLINAFYDADANELYTAHNVFKDLRPDTMTGDYPESAVRWYEVTPAGKLKNSGVARKGTIGAPEVDVGWPSVATDAAGNLFVAYNRASAVTGEFLSAYVAEIVPGATAATQLLLTAGTGTYDAVPGAERWGDYTAITRDPVTGNVATFNQFAVSATTWQQVVHLVQHV